MALDIYSYATSYTACDEYGDSPLVNPVKTTHDGVLGETRETILYVRNDNATYWYDNISIEATSQSGAIPTGWVIKMRGGTTQPTEAEWDAIAVGNTIVIDDIGEAGVADTTTYSPFWYRIEIPAGTTAQTRQVITLKLLYTENVV